MPDGTDMKRPLTTRKLVTKQLNDPSCRQVAYSVGNPGSIFLFDRNIRQALIEGALQKVGTCITSCMHTALGALICLP